METLETSALKECSVCHFPFPVESFSWRIKAKGIRQPNCKTCAASVGRGYREQRKALMSAEELVLFEKERYAQNRDAQLAYHKARYQENPEPRKAYNSRWYKKNRAYALQQARAYGLLSQFGLTTTDYDAMVEAQGNLCAICGKNGRKLHVDHDHATGRIRGLLCAPCNSFLGRIQDSLATLERIKAYLDPTYTPTLSSSL